MRNKLTISFRTVFYKINKPFFLHFFLHFLLIFLLIFLQGCQTRLVKRKIAANDIQPFDEIYGTSLYDNNNGQNKRVRAPYQGIIQHYQTMSKKQIEEFQIKSTKMFQGDNALAPIPRILSQDEFNLIRKGTYQRANAISLFLKDHYSGNKKYLKDGIMPPQIIDQIIARANESEWAQYMNGANIAFWYGPDIIRGPSTKNFPEGKFFIVEDNPSFIGGIGDLIKAREVMDKIAPQYQKIANSPDPSSFYRRMTNTYKRKAKQNGGIAILVQYSKEYASDNEDKRVKQIFKNNEIATVNIDPFKNSNQQVFPQLKVDDQKVTWFIDQNGKKQRVGYIINNMDPADLEISHPANRKYFLLELMDWYQQTEKSKSLKSILKKSLIPNAKTGKIDWIEIQQLLSEDHFFRKKLNNNSLGVKGIFASYFSGKIGMTNTPGLEFIGDKEFYIYIEDMIRYYLKEEPILNNMKTKSFEKVLTDGKMTVNQKRIDHVFSHFEDYVVKAVDGRGGDAVWVGRKTDNATKQEVKTLILNNPQKYIFQEYNHLSTMNGYIGDLRMISDVHSDKINLANVPWARVVPVDGDGKVNISRSGFEATVMVRRPTLRTCIHLMEKVLEKVKSTFTH